MKISLDNSLTLGKYAIKLGLAATLAFVIAQWLRLEHPIYALIAPIIIMGTTPGSTWTAGINRLKGTVIGAIAGAIFASVFGNHPISILAVSTLVIFICRYLHLEEAYRLAGYVSAIVVISYSQHPWLYAWGRFLETTLGIGVAFVVNTFLWSSPATEDLRVVIIQMLTDLEKLYQTSFNAYITKDYSVEVVNELKDKIIQAIRKSESLWKEAKKEQSGEAWVDENWEFLLRMIWQHVATMSHAALDRREDTLWQELSPQLMELADVTSRSFKRLVEVVANKKTSVVLPHIKLVLMDAIAQLEKSQKSGYNIHPAGEIIRFASLFYSMEEIAKSLQKMSNNFS